MIESNNPIFEPFIICTAICLSNLFLPKTLNIIAPLLACSSIFAAREQCQKIKTAKNKPELVINYGNQLITASDHNEHYTELGGSDTHANNNNIEIKDDYDNTPVKHYLGCTALLVHVAVLSSMYCRNSALFANETDSLSLTYIKITSRNIICIGVAIGVAKIIKHLKNKETTTADAYHQNLMKIMTGFCFFISITEATRQKVNTTIPEPIAIITSPIFAMICAMVVASLSSLVAKLSTCQNQQSLTLPTTNTPSFN